MSLTALSGLSALYRAPSTGLNFSALPALPSAQYATVTTNAELAAIDATTETGSIVTAQDVVNALAAGRGMAILLPGWGCLLASSGGAEVAQGAAVGAIRTLAGTELATQANVSLMSVSSAVGLANTGTANVMSLGDLSSWTQGEAVVCADPNNSISGVLQNSSWFTSTDDNYLPLGSTGPNWEIYECFGITTRHQFVAGAPAINRFIYQPRVSSSGAWVVNLNGSTIMSQTGRTVSFSASSTILKSRSRSSFQGTWQAFALNSALYTTAQRSAIKHFLKHLLSISGVV